MSAEYDRKKKNSMCHAVGLRSTSARPIDKYMQARMIGVSDAEPSDPAARNNSENGYSAMMCTMIMISLAVFPAGGSRSNDSTVCHGDRNIMMMNGFVGVRQVRCQFAT